MPTITDSELNQLFEFAPVELVDQITKRLIAKSFKGEMQDLELNMGPGEPVTVRAEQLSEHWFITPTLKRDKKPHRIRRSVTHLSGLRLCSLKNRTKAVQLWNKIKDLDIHYSDPNVHEWPDVNQLRSIVFEFERKHG